MDEFKRAIDDHRFDIAWSALYYITDKVDIVGLNVDDDAWLADIFDRRQIPYIGPNALTMRQLINKTWTHRILDKNKIAVPRHHQVDVGEGIPDIKYPAFVKPSCESRSIGISDESVVHTRKALKARVRYIHENFEQPALIEDYLPGEEYTVLMIGNGENQEFLPGVVTIKGGEIRKISNLKKRHARGRDHQNRYSRNLGRRCQCDMQNGRRCVKLPGPRPGGHARWRR